MEPEPASHPGSNFTDVKSVSLVQYILAEHGRVISNISSVDKWPNIDGRVEIQDEHNNLIGTLSVQVKTLASNHNLKYDCEVSFLAYCEKREPCLLLAVDHQTKKVYWLYFDVYNVREIDYKDNQHTKTIYFKASQYFNENTKGYIEEWIKIVEDNRQRFQHYDELRARTQQLEKLLKNSNKAVGMRNTSFVAIHRFLDELNRQFDTDFPTVKNFFYPQAWKLGMAYARYEDARLDYTLFPIPVDRNDVHIKEVDSDLFQDMLQSGFGFREYSGANPIQASPTDYAKKIVKSKVLKLMEMKGLSPLGHELLAREYVIAFLDKFHEQMCLPGKDEYSLSEVQSGFHHHLLLWIEEAYGLLLRKRPTNIQVQIMRDGFDPDIIQQLGPEERREILQNVSKRLDQGQRPIRIGTKKLNIGVFIECFNYLKQCNSPITRIYKKPDFFRLKNKGGGIWSAYSPDDAEYNFRIAFQNLQEAYRVVVANNFPTLVNELDLFKGADRILVHCTVRDEYQGFETGPGFDMYYVKDENPAAHKMIEVIDNEQAKALNGLIPIRCLS